MRGYDAFRLLEERVKAMMLALPLVQDLHHPAMRDRHWLMLMKVVAAKGLVAIAATWLTPALHARTGHWQTLCHGRQLQAG